MAPPVTGPRSFWPTQHPLPRQQQAPPTILQCELKVAGDPKAPTPSNVHYENLDLKAEMKQLKLDLKSISSFIEKTGLFSQEQVEGLIRRRGRPPKGSNELKIREQRARSAMIVSHYLQGKENFARNIRDIVEVAVKEDATVLTHIAHVLRTHNNPTTMPDKRFNCGERELDDSTLISTRNAALAQFEGNITNRGINTIRKYGGKTAIGKPEMLQKWAAHQPEIPLIQFVAAGASTAVSRLSAHCGVRTGQKILWATDRRT